MLPHLPAVIKKNVGETSLLIPLIWPSHCLSVEISNSASPRRSRIINNVYHTNVLPKGEHQWHTGIIHPARTPRCDIFRRNQSCEVRWVKDNVQKTSISCPSARLVADAKSAVSGARSEHGIQNVLTHPLLADWLSQGQIYNIILITHAFLCKNVDNAKI